MVGVDGVAKTEGVGEDAGGSELREGSSCVYCQDCGGEVGDN